MTKNKNDTDEWIKTNQDYVELIVKQYLNRGLTTEQLINEGNRGLAKAAECYYSSIDIASFMRHTAYMIRAYILQALAAVEQGEPIPTDDDLTPRERGILRGIEDGETLTEIAAYRRLTELQLIIIIKRIKYKMSKNKDQKRKAQLTIKAKNESFRFQVEYIRKRNNIDITGLEQEYEAELNAICQSGLTEDLFVLSKIVDGVRCNLGFKQEDDKCSLKGALVPFILGITSTQPDSSTYVPGIFTAKIPLQVSIAYDNEIRNRVVDWVKANYDGVTTRLGKPILKMENMVVEFNRVIK
jgi:DNA-binding NarL/FixJ family response regulator